MKILKTFIKESLNQPDIVGVITASNPQEQQKSKYYNSIANSLLFTELESLGYDPLIVYYFNEESFLVPNISLNELIELANKYNQKSVLYGRKISEDRQEMAFSWKYIEDGKVIDHKRSNNMFDLPIF